MIDPSPQVKHGVRRRDRTPTLIFCLLGIFAFGNANAAAQPPAQPDDQAAAGAPQTAPAAAESNPSASGPAEAATQAEQASAAQLQSRAQRLIESLGGKRFAERERASEQLYQLGFRTLPMLREALQRTDDQEQSARLSRLITTLREVDLEARIESFLRGEDAELENWPALRKWFGDSPRVREIFVELYREHPQLVESLGGTPQELMLAMAEVKSNLVDKGVGRQIPPGKVDLIALLLPMTDPNFPAYGEYDRIVVSLMQLYTAKEFLRDRVLGDSFRKLVSAWMLKSHLSSREGVLRLALEWELDIAMRLARETLAANPDPELLARCLQTIARLGAPADAALVARYLDDGRVVVQKRFLGQAGGDIEVGDVAAATIARLMSVPVTEIGFAVPAEHDIFGIIYEELMIPMPDGDTPAGEKQLQQARRDIHEAARKLVPDAAKVEPQKS
ncbi:hypothetical protein FYK55_19190 [Roseiconus nitratireducens]|uniref:Chemotaxis protein MotC n=1 Tax=Roseiconus nitratireducens TaxID=2605748 RepID=A0A5M6D756_9BACT|nr:hypothetical protein [Roseiconus nitratireducens]KAA5541025.1 hypothetical protein FYK55_19190 [Roseiconus nitratireducens]